MATPFVPDEFVVPLSLQADTFTLEPLGPQHNERDYAAWTSSMAFIHTLPGYLAGEHEWPIEMPLAQNLADLEMHERHFADRVGFTYTVLDGDDVIGCVYIYPDTDGDADVAVRSWVTEHRAHLDVPLWRTVSDWLADDWPFSTVAYAARR